jgi:stalled ribosome rescue protein Dom34
VKLLNPCHCAIVWINHSEAKVFHVCPSETTRIVIDPYDPAQRICHKANLIADGHSPLDHEFFEEVAEAITNAKAILLTGPASAKSELFAHIVAYHYHLVERFVAIETIEHPGDCALIAVANLHFKTRISYARKFQCALGVKDPE